MNYKKSAIKTFTPSCDQLSQHQRPEIRETVYIIQRLNAMCPPTDLASSGVGPTKTHTEVPSLVPHTRISISVYEHAASLLDPAILNHSLRVYLYARALAQHTASAYSKDSAKLDLLFTACLFHDLGTTSTYNGEQRFEVEGADVAKNHLSQFGVSEEDKHDVWTAIAIHTSPGIAERISELSRLVRIGVLTDFNRSSQEYEELLEPLREGFEEDFRRQGIEKVLGDAVVEQAKSRPEKAPNASWPGVMYRAWLAEPEWNGVNKSF